MAPEIVKSGVESVGLMVSRAYVTLLAGNGDYVKGVVGLAKGLRKVKAVYPLVVAALPGVPEEHRRILSAQGCIVREIQPVYPPENYDCQYANAYDGINYSKLRIWEFVDYKKMIYLDGDIQVYENIDHLFDLPDGCLYAVLDCFCEPSWSRTPQYKIGYCQQCPERVQWPVELGPKPPLYFNAGFFVHEPSIATYNDLLANLNFNLNVTPCNSFGELDFLNMYFKDKLKPLPIEYNLVLAFLWRHPDKVDLNRVKVVNYCAAGCKPWRYIAKVENMDREDIKMLVKRWRDIYNDPSLDYKPATAEPPTAPRAVDLEPLREALSEAGVVNNVTATSVGLVTANIGYVNSLSIAKEQS